MPIPVDVLVKVNLTFLRELVERGRSSFEVVSRCFHITATLEIIEDIVDPGI